MKTLHVHGYKKDIDLLEFFSDNYAPDISFPFEEEGEDTIPNAFIRIYQCDERCNLAKSVEGSLRKLYGDITLTGQEYGYSEYTVEGFNVTSLKFGGHDLQQILDSYKDNDYLHILIDQVERWK